MDQSSAESEAGIAAASVVNGEEPLVVLEDEWSNAQGYTPLQDMNITEGLFSDGGSTTFYTSHPGSLFANLTASDINENDNHDNDSDMGATFEVDVSSLSALDIHREAPDNFRSLADHALMALENEYHRTLACQDERIDSLYGTSADHSPACNDNFTIAQPDNTKDTNEEICSSMLPLPCASYQEATESYKKPFPDIDANAVRRAVQSIQLQNPKLKQNFVEWERSNKAKSRDVAPRLHPIIPLAPLAAFRKQTAKAISATSNLSRSACIAEALRRFDLLQSHWNVEKTLRIHIVGCDRVECETSERLRTLFGPIVRWIGAYAEAPSHIHIDLIGPNIPECAILGTPLDLLPINTSALKECLQSATLSCHCGLYDEWLSTSATLPDLAIAFNAGVWGYKEWETTIAHLINTSLPFVVTAYTIQEAEDDEDSIRKLIDRLHSNSSCEWESEPNPYSSNLIRDTESAPHGREYRENAAWQGWRL